MRVFREVHYELDFGEQERERAYGHTTKSEWLEPASMTCI